MNMLPAQTADLSPIRPDNPADLGFPPMLPVELAMRTAPVQAICEAYGLTKDDLACLTHNTLFVQAYNSAVEALTKDGMSFKFKSQLLAEASLKQVHAIINDKETPKAVQLDAIKTTARWAGYEQKVDAASSANNFQININLG